MKALFLAGGKGTRLRPLTDKVPKPMVPVMGEPLLKRSIEKAKTHGVREVVLSTCYRADYFANYFRSVNPGVKLRFITEESPLGTGGAIKNAQPFLTAHSLFSTRISSVILITGKCGNFIRRKRRMLLSPLLTLRIPRRMV